MTTARYNPLTYSDNLKKAGMDEKIANVIAQQQDQIISENLNINLATREDITSVLKCLYAIQNDLKSLELRMTIKFGAIMLAGVALLTFLSKHS